MIANDFSEVSPIGSTRLDDAAPTRARHRTPGRQGKAQRPFEQANPPRDRDGTPGRHARSDAMPKLEGPGARLGDAAEGLASTIRNRPTEALLSIAGLGFILGGALTFRAGRVALGAALRHASRELLKQLL